jgi:hypothetical protein
MRDESANSNNLNPVDALDSIKPELETFAWVLGPATQPEKSAAAVRRACDLIESAKFRQLSVPNLYEGDVSSEWCVRILIGPRRKDGLGKYDKERSLGRFVSHGMEMDIRDLRRANGRRRAVEMRPELEPADNRGSWIDAHENRELARVALARVKARTEPGSLMFRILETMDEYLSNFTEWPTYQQIADKLGINGNRNHICQMRNKALKAIDDEILKMLNGF